MTNPSLQPDRPLSVAIFGGRGMLGTDLGHILRRQGMHVQEYDLPELDICAAGQVEAALATCDLVVNCAAYTNVDAAQANAALARAVNATAVGLLGRLAAQHNRYVLHISTDFVFDGKLARPYCESDQPQPLSVYGATKLEGEQLLQDSGCRHAIVRIQWTYGLNGANFISKVIERARLQPEVAMVNDQLGSPTWTMDVAAALAQLLTRQIEGLYHLAADGYATRYELAAAALQALGIATPLRACATADFPAPAQRPLNSQFDCSRIDKILTVPRPAWRESLQSFCRCLQDQLHCKAAFKTKPGHDQAAM